MEKVRNCMWAFFWRKVHSFHEVLRVVHYIVSSYPQALGSVRGIPGEKNGHQQNPGYTVSPSREESQHSPSWLGSLIEKFRMKLSSDLKNKVILSCSTDPGWYFGMFTSMEYCPYLRSTFLTRFVFSRMSSSDLKKWQIPTVISEH